MANTVVAIFEDLDGARQAERFLLEQGFNESEISLKTAVYKEDPSDAQKGHEPDIMESIKTFFKDLFGEEDSSVSTYHHASRNRTIVTVHTKTYEDAEHVVSILDQYGAINVHETAGSYFPDNQDKTQRASAIKSRIIQRAVNNENRQIDRI